jgi:hypothetical protein
VKVVSKGMAEQPASTRREVMREVGLSLFLGGAAPFIMYSLLQPRMSELHALLVATSAPLLQNGITLVRKRTLDVFGSFILAGLCVSIVLVLLGGNPKLLLIRESILTGATALVFLLSLLYRRPLIYYFALHFNTGDDPERRVEWSARWVYPYFRFVMRLMTAVWGVATLVEALARSYLVFHLSTQSFLALSPFVQYGIIGGTVVWTVWYARRAQRRGEQMRQARQAG